MHEHRDHAETATSGPDAATTPTPGVDEVGVDDLLEDVSIDGMCGVY